MAFLNLSLRRFWRVRCADGCYGTHEGWLHNKLRHVRLVRRRAGYCLCWQPVGGDQRSGARRHQAHRAEREAQLASCCLGGYGDDETIRGFRSFRRRRALDHVRNGGENFRRHVLILFTPSTRRCRIGFRVQSRSRFAPMPSGELPPVDSCRPRAHLLDAARLRAVQSASCAPQTVFCGSSVANVPFAVAVAAPGHYFAPPSRLPRKRGIPRFRRLNRSSRCRSSPAPSPA